MSVYAVVQCLAGRFLLIAHAVAVIAFCAYLYNNALYGVLGIASAFQLAEALYMVCRRRGYEYKWLSVSTFCYLVAVVPPVWFIELESLNNTNSSTTAVDIAPLSNFSVSQDIGRQFLKQTLLLVIMVHRWIIPRGALTRNSLSQLLFVFFAMASDILELFELFGEENILRETREGGVVGYAILGVWTLSLLQMCMVLTNTRNAVRARPLQMQSRSEFENAVGEDPPGPDCCYSTMATDLWSVIFTLVTMDVPFLCVRMYVLVKLKVYSYGIIFFTVKNYLVICLSIYRLIIICCGRWDSDEEDEHGGKQTPPPTMSREQHKPNQIAPVA